MSDQTSQAVTRDASPPYTPSPRPTERSSVLLQPNDRAIFRCYLSGNSHVEGFHQQPPEPSQTTRQAAASSVQTAYEVEVAPIQRSYPTEPDEKDLLINQLETQLAVKTHQLDEITSQLNEMLSKLTQRPGQDSVTHASSVGSLPQLTPSATARPGIYEAVFGADTSGKLMLEPTPAELMYYRFINKDGRKIGVNISAALMPEWDYLARLCNFKENLIESIKTNIDKSISRLMFVIKNLREKGMDQTKPKEVDFTWKTLFEKIAALDEVRKNEGVQALAKHMGVTFEPLLQT